MSYPVTIPDSQIATKGPLTAGPDEVSEAFDSLFNTHSYETVVDALRTHAELYPAEPIFTFLNYDSGSPVESTATFAWLDKRARAVAANLQHHTAPGDRALLLLAPGLDFIVAFFGCLYAGVVAVPTYLPNAAQRSLAEGRLAALAEDAQPLVALTTDFIQPHLEPMTSSIPEFHDMHWLAVDRVSDNDADRWSPPELGEQRLAFLQYTSGSTGQPKGVMVTHGNLMHNCTTIAQTLELTAASIGVGWTPPYHDMGLIAQIALPPVIRMHTILMSPLDFLEDPARWLHAITKYRATASAAPNFAFDFCARKMAGQDLSSLDLSSWEVVANGAEPIRPEALDTFSEMFACVGFRRETILPVYGLAESTLIVSGGPLSSPRITKTFDAQQLESGIAVPASDTSSHTCTLSSCGISLGSETIIVDPQHRTRMAPGHIGEIWVAGKSVALGYWQRPSQTRDCFQATLRDAENDGPFLRTGDLGFQTSDGLFVTGRIKDVIIINGKNHYPQDIERTVERSSELTRPGCVVVFDTGADNNDSVVVAAELRRDKPDRKEQFDREELIRKIRARVTQAHRITVKEVVLLPAGSLPKTSSGKLQRTASRNAYLAGHSPWNAKGAL